MARSCLDLGGLLKRVGRACQAVVNLLAGFLLLVGCQGVVPGPTPTLEPSKTATPSLSPTATMTPTFTVTPTATATPTATVTVTPSPTLVPLHVEFTLGQAQVAQGHTVGLQVMTNRPCRVAGVLGEQPLGFVSEDGLKHVALVGISAIATPGTSILAVRARAEEGQEVALTTALYVVAGHFGHETLSFSPQVAKLLDPKITEAEQKRLSEVYVLFTPRMLWQGVFTWPSKGAITSEFGTRRGYENREGSYHAGIDIGGNIGDLVRAPAAGVVVLAEPLRVRGNAVIIDHGAGVLSSYYHLDRIEVQVGQFVQQGDILGRVGATGLVTGAHLHWEIRVRGVAVDPREWTVRQFP